MNIREVLETYDKKNITIAALGGHSALDVCRGAKKHGFKTLAVCQRGREKTYAKHYRSRGSKGCIDECVVLDRFSDVTRQDIVEDLQRRGTIFVHNRYFWVYFDDFSDIEQRFPVPIYGSRSLVKLEERDIPKNQYYLLEKAGIRMPRMYESPDDIDRLVIVKVNEAQRGYERAFFFANSPETYEQRAKELLDAGTITSASLVTSVIEEYITGAQVNFNFFYSPLSGGLELMGTDTRRQTNLDGLLRLPADVQLEVLGHVKPKLIETGHIAVTTKESLLEKAFAAGEKFVSALEREVPPGIIGPFALQGAIASEEGREELVVFDVSLRIPGSPGTMFTPYTAYLHGEPISYGERIAMEVREAIDKDCLEKICT